MRCPVDNEVLVMADRGGVEIDYCPKCRGVWLDRGELDKIIERSLGGSAASAAPSAPDPTARPMAPPMAQPMFPGRQATPIYQPEPRAPQHRDDGRRRHDDDDDYRHGSKKKRKDSFLKDIFDF